MMATTPMVGPIEDRPPNLQNPHYAALDDRERAFVLEYPLDFNAIRAAERAGYGKNNKTIAYEILRRPHVSDALLYDLELRAAKNNIIIDRVLEEIASVAFSRLDNYVIDDYGNISLRSGAPVDSIRAVSRIKKRIRHEKDHNDNDVVTYETDIYLWNKVEALNMLMKHLGAFIERKVTATGSLEELMKLMNNQPNDPRSING